MQVEVGEILEGKVTGITKFGAFVELPNGKTGMVHISEVASSFVNDINEHLSENQTVKVKVLNIDESNNKSRIALSIKQALPNSNSEKSNGSFAGGNRGFRNNNNFEKRDNFRYSDKRNDTTPKASSFEDLMSKFKKASDEKMMDLKRSTESKRGSSPKRNKSGN